MNTYRLTGVDFKIKDFNTFISYWNNKVDFILNGLSDYGEIGSSNGYLNKEEFTNMYEQVFKSKFIEIVTEKGNYIVSSNLLINV